MSFQQFHSDEGSPVGLVDFVNGANVRVVQRRCGLGLPLEPAEGLRIVGEFVGKELQGNMATESQVFCLMHHTHAPTADPAQDAVMGNRLTHGLGGRGHWLDMLGGDERPVNESGGSYDTRANATPYISSCKGFAAGREVVCAGLGRMLKIVFFKHFCFYLLFAKTLFRI
jgi:hypothetical protein